jgi:hypothetical protein
MMTEHDSGGVGRWTTRKCGEDHADEDVDVSRSSGKIADDGRERRKSWFVIPALFMMFAERMKKGMASRMKEPYWIIIRWSSMTGVTAGVRMRIEARRRQGKAHRHPQDDQG